MNQLVTLPAANNGKMLRHIFAALSASLISVGIARFAYTPLLPVLIEARWLSVSAAVYLSAAGLAGYLVGALLGRRLGARFTNVVVLRAMNIVAVASLAACAFPVAEWWFFVWRLAAGISGGATVVLVGATVLPHVPAQRRGIASGAIFLGIGLGILASGTVVPALLDYGLQAAWLGLAAFAAVLTAATWNAWPTSLPAANAQAKAAIPEAHPHVAILYVEFGLMALAPVAAMLFLVDFVSRELNAGTHIGSTFWIVYGVGAIIGPPAYGYLIDRFGAIVAVRWIFVVQCVCLVWLSYANDVTSIGFISLMLGTFTAGVVPLVLAWLREVIPGDVDRQNKVWSGGTVVFAGAQVTAGYAYSAILAANGGFYRELFLFSGAAIGLALLINLIAPRDGLKKC